MIEFGCEICSVRLGNWVDEVIGWMKEMGVGFGSIWMRG